MVTRFAMRPGITGRRGYDAARLRGLAQRTKSAAQGRLLLALAEIYEQAHQAALDDHVHRPTRLGQWVLISGSWY